MKFTHIVACDNTWGIPTLEMEGGLLCFCIWGRWYVQIPTGARMGDLLPVRDEEHNDLLAYLWQNSMSVRKIAYMDL